MPNDTEIEVAAEALRKYLRKNIKYGSIKYSDETYNITDEMIDEALENEMGRRSRLAAKRMLEAAEKASTDTEANVTAEVLRKYIGQRLMYGFCYAGEITPEIIEHEMGRRSKLVAKRMLEAAEKVRTPLPTTLTKEN